MYNYDVNDISVLLVDDQTLLRQSLAALLGMMTDLRVVGSAPDASVALQVAEREQPDVALVDVRMPGMTGIGLIHALQTVSPHTRVIVLTTFDDDEYLFASLNAGAVGYLLKTADLDALSDAIRRVAAGEAVLDPSVTQRVIRRAVQGEAAREDTLQERLTRRERTILRLMAQGSSNAEIAAQLYLSEGTVKNHISHILGKLAVRDRTQAVRLAVEWGLLLGE